VNGVAFNKTWIALRIGDCEVLEKEIERVWPEEQPIADGWEPRGPLQQTRSTMASQFSGGLAKLLEATVSFVMSVRPSVRPSVRMEQLGCHRTDFHEIQYFFDVITSLVSL
jgi:hypothetical protein